MAVSIYLDTNVWDFLFERQLDLEVELPSDEFCICITREAEFEIPPIPDGKAELKMFIEATIARCGIQTTRSLDFTTTAFHRMSKGWEGSMRAVGRARRN